MGRIANLFKKSIKNPTILYVLSRYATYIIQFINSLFIAVYLGPFYLGIWGFINLVLGYLAQLNLGIPHSINVIVSVNKEKEEYVKTVIGNGFLMIVGLSVIIILFFSISYAGGFIIGGKYEFNNYLIPVTIIAVLTHFNSFFSNIFRIFGKIFAIALNQSLFPILTILIIPFFRGSELLWALVIVNVISVLISIILYIIQTPVSFKLKLDFNTFKYIHKRGWPLFVYNTSFYLILLTTKSFISASFSVEEYGYFTFSYSLVNAIFLFLDALSYLVFPKMLNRFANGSNEHIRKILGDLRNTYISTSHLLVHLLIMIFPLFLLIFPNYRPASDVFKVTALTVVLYTNSFGYQAVLMARGKEKQIAFKAFGSLLINVILIYFFIFILNVQFSYVMFGTMIVHIFYVLQLGVTGRKELRLSTQVKEVFKDFFPINMFIPFTLSVLFILFSVSNVFFIIPFALYILLNIKGLLKVKELVVKIIKNPNFINI